MGVLAKFDRDPIIPVVDTPDKALVLEAASFDLGGGVDAPFVRGCELAHGALVNEA